MFLSSLSVSCQCLPLILIAVPVPGKELQGHSSQKLLPPLLLLLLLNVVAAVSGDSPVRVSGFLGEQVVLPCTYKGSVPVSDLQIIWGTSRSEIVHKFVNGSDDFRQQDPQFKSRTKLFKDQLEQGNWSVLISDLRETDQAEYQCQIYSRMGDRFRWLEVVSVHLSVTERAPTPGPNTPVPGDSPVPVSGFLGEQVVLPCTYKGNVPVSDLWVIWSREKEEILSVFVDGNDDLTQQDPETERTCSKINWNKATGQFGSLTSGRQTRTSISIRFTARWRSTFIVMELFQSISL
ncbi:CD276 antigen homolog [Hemiscyllium ocellatum]|uniref:CD276 antigen homolog n=1 Tax=Hemiscyllium ocellatum TaxID=170820 RepID=UPI0029673028|nr:CD276 antigen homolog [Hemiscyllium ocellatum]